MAAKTVKNADSNASLSSATAATVSLRFNDNSLKRPKKEQNNLLTFTRGGVPGGGRGGGACPRILCACFVLQYSRTISNLLPTGLL